MKINFTQKHNWYCWQCGDKIGDKFTLWSMNDRIDRVFIICSKKYCFDIVMFGDEKKYVIIGKKQKSQKREELK
ncbi:MAG: hypothetical protein AABY22_31910 [Nanoarchaeota archaeon]